MSFSFMRNAISYIRVSTDRQNANGIGLDAQQAQIEKFAEVSGYCVSDRYNDCHSGVGERSAVERPGLQSAIRRAKESGCPIIVAGYDRISRHSKTLERIVREEGIEIFSASDGRHTDPVVILSRGARAQREAEEISKRTKEALRIRKEQGIRLGNTKNLPEAQRKGAESNRRKARQRDSEMLVIVERELAFGRTSAKQMADALNEAGIRTARGGRWNASNVRRPLKRIGEAKSDSERGRNMRNPMWGTF